MSVQVIAERTGTDASRLESRDLNYRLAADRSAPGRVRDALEGDLDDIDGGARLTVELLARALVAMCIRGEGGTVQVEVSVGSGQVRVEVSGEGSGFRLPLSARSIDYFSFEDGAAPPPGWRTYLIGRLADDWGVDEDAGVAWVEVDHATDAARRLQTHVRALAN
jgi:hypothetical protein